MFGSTYEWDTIRKYVIAFGVLFNNLSVTREDAANNTVQTLRIPLTYSDKDKMLLRFTTNKDEKKPVSIVNPMMAFQLTGFQYDNKRKLNTLNKKLVRQTLNPSKIFYQYSPVPYNLGFSLYIAVKNQTDGTRILEQILPKFTPDWEIKVVLHEEMQQEFNTPIIIKDIQKEDTYEGDLETVRAITYTINFIVKAYLLGPEKTSGLIKVVTINMRVPEANDTSYSISSNNIAEQIEVYPGLLPGGLVGTSNATLTIPLNEIQPDSPYGIITKVTDFE